MEYPKMDAWMLDEIKRKRRDRQLMWWGSVIGMVFLIAFTVVLGIVLIVLTQPVEAAILITDAPPVEKVRATVTAYTSSVDETDDTPFITASGAQTRSGIVACPRQYEFGTRVSIGGQEYVCEDRLHQRFDDRFDIWMETKAAAFEFGKQRVDVVILGV